MLNSLLLLQSPLSVVVIRILAMVKEKFLIICCIWNHLTVSKQMTGWILFVEISEMRLDNYYYLRTLEDKMSQRSGAHVRLHWPAEYSKYRDEYDLGTINQKGLIKKRDGDMRFISPKNSVWISRQGDKAFWLKGASGWNHLEVAGSIPTTGKTNKVWFLCLMAYQLFLGYLMPKPFSKKNSSGTI